MLKRLILAAVVPLFLSACAGVSEPAMPPAPPPLDPTGTFDVSINEGGMAMGGVMTISGSAADGYTGRVDTDMGGASMSDITIDGQRPSFYVPEAGVSVQLEFDGDEFTGEMDGDMGAGTISGKRRSSS